MEHIAVPVLEQLRAIRADMGAMKMDVGGIRAEMLIMRRHMAGLLGSQTSHGTKIAGFKVRLDRIAHQFELVQ